DLRPHERHHQWPEPANRRVRTDRRESGLVQRRRNLGAGDDQHGKRIIGGIWRQQLRHEQLVGLRRWRNYFSATPWARSTRAWIAATSSDSTGWRAWPCRTLTRATRYLDRPRRSTRQASQGCKACRRWRSSA